MYIYICIYIIYICIYICIYIYMYIYIDIVQGRPTHAKPDFKSFSGPKRRA